VEVMPPIMVLGEPDEKTMQALDRLADEILKKHKELNIV